MSINIITKEVGDGPYRETLKKQMGVWERRRRKILHPVEGMTKARGYSEGARWAAKTECDKMLAFYAKLLDAL